MALPNPVPPHGAFRVPGLGHAGRWRLAASRLVLAPQRPDFWARPRPPATKHARTCSVPPGPCPGLHPPTPALCLVGGGGGAESDRRRAPRLWSGWKEEPEVPSCVCAYLLVSLQVGVRPLPLRYGMEGPAQRRPEAAGRVGGYPWVVDCRGACEHPPRTRPRV